jgi:hypothetical protein
MLEKDCPVERIFESISCAHKYCQALARPQRWVSSRGSGRCHPRTRVERACDRFYCFALLSAVERDLGTAPNIAVFYHLFTKYRYLSGFGMIKGSILAELYALMTGCLSDKIRQTQLSLPDHAWLLRLSQTGCLQQTRYCPNASSVKGTTASQRHHFYFCPSASAPACRI